MWRAGGFLWCDDSGAEAHSLALGACRGWWHRARGDREAAKREAAEALRIADRCEYRLTQAEIHNFLARLAIDAGDVEAGKQHAGTARERALCDGGPHCYKPALDEAEGLLTELKGR